MIRSFKDAGVSALQVAVIVFLLVLGSCKDNSATAQKNTTPSKAKVPDMDIHTAVVNGNMEVVKQHLAAGTDINVKDPFGGSSPLISACLFGKTDIATLLINAGADLNFRNNDGSTALHTAAFFCRPELVSLLLKKGADKAIKNKYGQTAYETVIGSFADAKKVYDMLGKMLGPMGLKLDYAYLEKTRPEIAVLLK
ncbi:ankyrin repeat domain-containing protein [Paraflavitalea soli]|nr:ankyrin repeat domain-containing protein [Paraflavitalea soli]